MTRKDCRDCLAYLICFFVAWATIVPVQAQPVQSPGAIDEAQLRSQYPQAKMVHVDVADYPLLASELSRQGYTRLAQNTALPLAESDNSTSPVDENTRKPATGVIVDHSIDQDDCIKNSKNQPDTSEESLRVIVDISSDIMKSGDSGSGGEGAALVFVIIGTVLLVVWALYLFKFLYDVASGFRVCDTWSNLVFTSSSISASNTHHARFNGIRFSTGFRDNRTDVGINIEMGKADILLEDLGAVPLKGNYWLMGPMLRWRLSSQENPHYFQMNFLAGSTENDELDLIAQAKLGFQFAVSSQVNLGLHWGVLNIDLKDDQGIISERDDYYYMYGIDFGMRF